MNHLDKCKEEWKEIITQSLLAKNKNISRAQVVMEVPPKPEMGDIAFPMFPFAKVFKKAPVEIAEEIIENIKSLEKKLQGTASASGPYVNIYLNRGELSENIITDVLNKKENFGITESLKGRKIMCEFSCPNTNKPLHLGHLRNDILGESVSRILKANSAEVLKVNLINDRGIHICKSMLAYKLKGNGTTPESEEIKSDHFVGKFYVKYDSMVKENPEIEEKARELLVAWENGDREVIELWKKMNKWTIDGIEKTYEKTGISFDKVYYESNTYSLGKEEILKGLKSGVFYKKDDGSIWVDLSKDNLEHKVLLRGDGTSLYITQDIGTAIMRHEDWPFDKLIYVVASEQKYHFSVLFKVLNILGLSWADNLYHLSYGMVNLPEGKMKSREGTVVDADDLLSELKKLALGEITEKEKVRESEGEIEDLNGTAEKIALGALNYYLLQTTPVKDMLFNPKESISFTGNTGPYLQYTGARIESIFRKYEQRNTEKGKFNVALLTVNEEWELIKLIADFSNITINAGNELSPSVITGYLYELAKTFNKYYHDNTVLNNDDPDLIETRLCLTKAVRQVLENGLKLLAVPFLERM